MKNISNNNPTPKNESPYKRQRNNCDKLRKSEKRRYYNNLDLKVLDSNKKFWLFIQPFSDKQKSLQKNITLRVNHKLISDKEIIDEMLNNFFIETVENLDIERLAANSDNDIKLNNLRKFLNVSVK